MSPLVLYTRRGLARRPARGHPRVGSGAHRSAMVQTTPSEVAGANSAAPVAVLVVDGNEDHQILSIAALTRKGWIVRTAATRKQGLQLALAYHFDAVVIGSKLRDGNGIELLRALGGRLPGTPIIFVVPLGGEEAALQAMESGAQSYIVKTPRYNELLPAIVEEHVVEARNRKRLVETEQTQAQAVTARKTVEEQLSQSQARLKLVLEQAPVLLWSTDRDLRVTSAMGTGFRGLDLPRSGERGLSIYEYFNIHDDDIEPIVSHRRALLGESVATQIEWQGRTYDVHMEPLRSKEGAILGTIGVAFDVSERTRTEESLRRSEERFLLLGRATNDVVWDWDLQTDGMWMNDNMAAMFGYRAEDVEPTGTWWEERLHPDDRGRVGASVDDLIGPGGYARGGGEPVSPQAGCPGPGGEPSAAPEAGPWPHRIRVAERTPAPRLPDGVRGARARGGGRIGRTSVRGLGRGAPGEPRQDDRGDRRPKLHGRRSVRGRRQGDPQFRVGAGGRSHRAEADEGEPRPDIVRAPGDFPGRPRPVLPPRGGWDDPRLLRRALCGSVRPPGIVPGPPDSRGPPAGGRRAVRAGDAKSPSDEFPRNHGIRPRGAGRSEGVRGPDHPPHQRPSGRRRAGHYGEEGRRGRPQGIHGPAPAIGAARDAGATRRVHRPRVESTPHEHFPPHGRGGAPHQSRRRPREARQDQ